MALAVLAPSVVCADALDGSVAWEGKGLSRGRSGRSAGSRRPEEHVKEREKGRVGAPTEAARARTARVVGHAGGGAKTDCARRRVGRGERTTRLVTLRRNVETMPPTPNAS